MKNKLFITKIAIISLLGISVISSVVGCIILKSGKDGKDGMNGSTNIIANVNGKIAVDGQQTIFDNEDMSAIIHVSSNNDKYGEVCESKQYPLNSIVNIYAKPYEGYVFKHWENEKGEKISTNTNYVTKACEVEQTFVAIFDVDKSNVLVDVKVRRDVSLLDTISIEGGGTYRYGEEYELSVTSTRAEDFQDGWILFYEVSKEEFDDDNFVVDFNSMKACASGQKVIFDVKDASNKYYVVGYKTKPINIVDVGNIDIVVSCSVQLESSNSAYGMAKVYKVNGTDYKEDATSIWPGDTVIVKARPTYLPKYKNILPELADVYVVERSSFAYWINLDNGKIVSTEREYSFIAKEAIHLKAVFVPKTIVHFQGKNTSINLITPNETYLSGGANYDEGNAFASFYPGEQVLVFCFYHWPTSTGLTQRYNKFFLEISYDGKNYDILSYDRQGFFVIPEDTPDIYIRASVDQK